MLETRERRRLIRAIRKQHKEPNRDQYLAVLEWAEGIVQTYELLLDVLEGSRCIEVSQDGQRIEVFVEEVH